MSSRLLNGRKHMTTEYTVVRSGKSKRKPFNSNVAGHLVMAKIRHSPLGRLGDEVEIARSCSTREWVRKVGSNANEKNVRLPLRTQHQHHKPGAFLDGVDWSAILIDLWEAPGWLKSAPLKSRSLPCSRLVARSSGKGPLRSEFVCSGPRSRRYPSSPRGARPSKTPWFGAPAEIDSLFL